MYIHFVGKKDTQSFLSPSLAQSNMNKTCMYACAYAILCLTLKYSAVLSSPKAPVIVRCIYV